MSRRQQYGSPSYREFGEVALHPSSARAAAPGNAGRSPGPRHGSTLALRPSAHAGSACLRRHLA